MKKPILAIMAFLLVAVILIPVYAGISNSTWLGATYISGDDYYRKDIVGYKEGATAVLVVTVQNTNASNTNAINVTRVYVSFDWGDEYNSTQMSVTNPAIIPSGQTRVYYVNFTVPSTTVASNMYTHSYTIYAEYKLVNATGWLKTGTYKTALYSDFAVFSTDQADAIDLARIIDNFSPPTGGWTSAKAKILWNLQQNETDSGSTYYEQGDFARAKQRFSTALDDINQAWDAEQTYLEVWEDIDIQESQARIRNLDAITSFFNGLSTMWVLFGIGWVLLGIGYIVKYLRTKRPEASATA